MSSTRRDPSLLGEVWESSGGSRRLIHQGPTEAQRLASSENPSTPGASSSANVSEGWGAAMRGFVSAFFWQLFLGAVRIDEGAKGHHRPAGGSAPTQHARVRCLCAVIQVVDWAPIQPRAGWQAQSLSSFASTLTEFSLAADTNCGSRKTCGAQPAF